MMESDGEVNGINGLSHSSPESSDDDSDASTPPPSPASSRSATPIPEGQFEVEKILNYVKDHTGQLYFVKWKNWDEDFNTWEPPENLAQCEVALTSFYLERRKEIEDLKAQAEFVETSDGKRRRKGPSIKLQLPPDPRPISMIAEEFYDATSSPTDVEIDECQTKWQNKRAAEKAAASGKSKPKKLKISTFVWPLVKITKVLQDGINGKLSESDVTALRTQLLYYEFERKLLLAADALKKWEKQMNDISMGNPLIKVENTVDFEGPPVGFIYINDYVPGPGINIPNDPPVGCSCEGSKCFDNRNSCCAHQFGSTFAYTQHRKLRVPIGTPVYECNNKCICGPECPNRVVQHGNSTLRLAIFRTASGMGWGVKTLKNIKRGQFVSLYVGEVIRTEEAERRGREYDAEGCTYLFDLDFNEGETCPFTVDAAKYGNIAHFINHSCDPNLAVFSVWVNCLDPNLPKLALFAMKDISHGEELFFDYKNDINKDGTEKTEKVAATLTNGDVLSPSENNIHSPTKSTTNSPKKFSSNSPKKNNSQETERKPCLCGTAKCRKFLF